MSVARHEAILLRHGVAGDGSSPADDRLLLLPAPPVAAPPVPWPVRAAGAVHAGGPGVVAPAVDLLSVSAVLLALPISAAEGAAFALGAIALLGLARVYRDRDRVVARGTGWWPPLLVGPLAVAGLLSAPVLGATPALLAAGSSLLALLAVRVLAWVVVAGRRQRGKDLVRALVVGRDDRARTLARTLARHPDFGLQVSLVVDEQCLTDPAKLARLVSANSCDHVFLLPGNATPPAGLRRALGVDAHVSVVPYGSDAFLDGHAGRRVGGVCVLPLGRPLRGPSAMRGKRAADVLLSATLLALLSPVLLVALLAVRLGDGGPGLYRQRRTGRGGAPFDIVKLRTMRPGAEGEQPLLTAYNTTDGLLFKMSDDPRVTRVGRLLRRTGLDELPQLVNVLRGQMSLVGPRPLPVDPDAFGPRDDERHLVRPGMTGLWQVSGGATLRYREMVDLDIAYVHGWTPGLDLHILGATVGVLLRASLGATGRDR